MKFTKKLFICLFVLSLFIMMFAFQSSDVKADTYVTNDNISVVGAGIRMTGNTGIRFVGKVEGYDTTNVKAYGIAIAYGEAELNSQFVVGGTVNSAAVLSATDDSGLDNDGCFYIVLFGIPESSYLDNVTARAYVVLNDDSIVYGTQKKTNSLGEIALKALNDGVSSELLNTIKSSVQTNNKKYGYDSFGNFVISDMYESDYKKLKAIFIADFNKVTGKSLTATSTYAQYKAAMMSTQGTLSGSTDITDAGLYQFYQNTEMKAKWTWLIDYFGSFTSYPHLPNQLKALKGDGVYDSTKYSYKFFQLIHMTEMVYNFFNMGSEITYPVPSFKNESNYTGYTSNVLANLGDYDVVKVGDKITLPTLTAQTGYNKGFVNNSNVYADGSEYTVTANNVKLVPTYTAIQYSITYILNDGTNPENAITTYDIEDTVTLPVPTKTNYAFLGWTLNEAGTDYVTTLDKTYGDKTFYANWNYAPVFDYAVSGSDVANLNTIKPTIIVNSSFTSATYTLTGTGLDTSFASTKYLYSSKAFSDLGEALNAASANDKIYVFAGNYSSTGTISANNVSVYGPNAGISYSGTRNTEAIYTGTINLGYAIQNVLIDGMKFEGASKIATNKCGDKSSMTYVLTGFNFKNNLVDKGNYSTAFIDFTSGDRVYTKDLVFTGSSFTGNKLSEALIHVINNENYTIDACDFHNLSWDVMIIDDSTNGYGECGDISITNTNFENLTRTAIWFDWVRPKASATANSANIYIAFNTFKSVNGAACIDFEHANTNTVIGGKFEIVQNKFEDVFKCVWVDKLKGLKFNYNIIIIDDSSIAYIVKGTTGYDIDCNRNLYYLNDGVTITTTPDSKYFNTASSSTATASNYASKADYDAAIAALN